MEKPLRILLLEDEPLLRKTLTLFLARQGYRMIASASPEIGETVLRSVGWDWPDLVITDANLGRNPDILHGYQFYLWWRSRLPLPPFLFMRAHGRLTPLPGGEDGRIGHIL